MKNSLIIISFFVAGLLGGIFSIVPDFLLNTDFSAYALYFLMFFVGIGVSIDKNAWKMMKAIKLKMLLVPLSAIIGTFLGVILFSLLFTDMEIREALAVGSGFGYYSLSSVLISEISGKTLGVIALISNVLRETITLLAAPFLAKYFGKLAPIASGGATSMDTTLPVVIKFSGKKYAIISIINGTILTIIVPFLVTFILKI
jgi:uncharacterized membrane protein YbjE (DUF340 family)